jgi:3-hydroxyacyl-CoA dehydrogenase
MQDDFWREVDRLLFDHCSPWEIDEAMTARGFGIGACEMQDLLGLDTVLRRRGANDPSGILSRMVAEGRLGKRAGWGYYRYPGGGGAVIDPLIEDLIREEAWFRKHPRSDLTVDELSARLTCAVARLRAACLSEGHARPDVDAALREGLRCPESLLI